MRVIRNFKVASALAELALDVANLDALMASDFQQTGRTVAEELTQKIATIGENMSLRRMQKIEVSSGVVVPYMHNATADGLGRIGVLVGLQSDADAKMLIGLGKQLAMHIAATAPVSLSVDDLDAELVAHEREVLIGKQKHLANP